ncbi:MAG: hypothetical protein IPM27_10095 [Nitrosomonadales bacterium]|nr:hypothetical protein [Nitrosomonadales bacterium]
MLKSLPVRLLWHSLNWLTRLVIVVSATIAVLIACAIIVLRYWVLPDIGQHHDRITESMAIALGNPVGIGRIEADWQGFHPRLRFSKVTILDERGQPALELPRIDGSVSWMSLLTAELRLASLEISRPELLIRRDAQGRIFIGGIALNKQGGDSDLANWLLHQSHMAVSDGLIVWVDELREAPPLVLHKVGLRFENFFGHHRFALRALPPAALSTPLDVRGDFHGDSFDDLGEWRGSLFTQLDYTDVTAWRPWLDLPDEFSSGRGALRGWLSLEGGKVTQLTADMDLHDVVTRLSADVQEMTVDNLHGRAAWQDVPGGLEVSTRHLAMRLKNGLALQPTDFYFRSVSPGEGRAAGGTLRANRLQLETLSSLAAFVPLEAGLRARLDAYAPRGEVDNLDVQWQGSLEKMDGFRIKGQFENLAMRQYDGMPGFSGLSLDVDGNDQGGSMNIRAHGLQVDAPGALVEPLFFSALSGQAGWERRRGEWSVTVNNVAIANDDLAGNLYGSYRTQGASRGLIDLTISLTRGDVRQAYRYTPLVALDKEDNDWLKGAIQSGQTGDFRVRIKGNLDDFPLDGTEKALLEIGGHAQGVTLEFDKDWPVIENISGEFWIRGNKLEVKAGSATTLGANLRNVSAVMPDLASEDVPLEIRGEATGASDVFLQYIQRSPVRGYIDSFTDGMHAVGDGHLDLFVRFPLLGGGTDTAAQEGALAADAAQSTAEQGASLQKVPDRTPLQVSGTYRVQDNDIDLGKGIPWLRDTRGELSFTESGMQAKGVSAKILGGDASIDMQTAEGGVVHAVVKGRSDLDKLRATDPHPLLQYLRGGAAWDADIAVVKSSAQLTVNSTLEGIGSSLPQPFAKRANEAMPLHVEKVNVAEGQDVIRAQLGKLLSVRLARRDENGAMAVKRGVIDFGGAGKWTDRDGVWLIGNLPVLSIQGWEGLAGDGESVSPLPIAGAKLSVRKLVGYGMTVNGLHIDAAERGDGLAAQLSSNVLNGEVAWLPHGYEAGGKFSVHLDNMQWPGDEPSLRSAPSARSSKAAQQPARTVQDGTTNPASLPALEVAIENLQIKGKQIGRFELVGHPEGQSWRMRRLRITNPDGSLMGDGIWYGNAPTIGSGDPAADSGKDRAAPQSGDGISKGALSQVNLQLEISDAGKILTRSGYPNTVKGGSGKLAANLLWSGTPAEFNYATLDGTLKLDTGKGQFLKMEPGIGKLLSILSLQALPKRITLDFTDVFSDGFQFDNINGNAKIKHGVMDTEDFHIDGSSAKVTMKGSVDLNRETQDLQVRILPTLGDSVSLLGAFAAGPVAGIGALIVNKVLGDPLDKLVSFEYNVTGTWNDPSVTKAGRAPARQMENQTRQTGK